MRIVFVALVLSLAACSLPSKERKCFTCSGTGMATCSSCRGSGSQSCSACHGTGFRCCDPCERGQKQTLCAVCKGQGRAFTCTTCQGAAKLKCVCNKGKAFDGSACRLCSGTGMRDCEKCIDGKEGNCGCCCGRPISAEMRAAHTIPCGVCNGALKAACKVCGASGKARCGDCGGDGKVKSSSSGSSSHHHHHHDWD